MTPRLAAKIEISALIRRIEGQGGTAAVLARGDPTAGAILLWVAERGGFRCLLERRLDGKGAYRWSKTGPQDVEDQRNIHDYIERRRRVDGDMWVLELDVADSERLTAEMIATG